MERSAWSARTARGILRVVVCCTKTAAEINRGRTQTGLNHPTFSIFLSAFHNV